MAAKVPKSSNPQPIEIPEAAFFTADNGSVVQTVPVKASGGYFRKLWKKHPLVNAVKKGVAKGIEIKSEIVMEGSKRFSRKPKTPEDGERKGRKTQFGKDGGQEDVAKEKRQAAQIGMFVLRIVEARGLPAADVNGKSDPYCVLMLEDQKMSTGIQYKTLSPTWGEEFSFPVTQSYSSVWIQVFDHDIITSDELLAQFIVELPRDAGVHKGWHRLHHPTHGTGKVREQDIKEVGEIYLEYHYEYSRWKEFVSHFTPLEKFQKEGNYPSVEKEAPKLKFGTLVSNMERFKGLIRPILAFFQFMGGLLTWDQPIWTGVSLVTFLLLAYFRAILASLPVLLLLVLSIRGYSLLMEYLRYDKGVSALKQYDEVLTDLADNHDEKVNEESSRQRIWGILTKIQNGLANVCRQLERVRDLFTWKEPKKSARLMVLLLCMAYGVWRVSMHTVLMIAGTYIFLVNAAFRRFPKLHRAYRKLNPLFKPPRF